MWSIFRQIAINVDVKSLVFHHISFVFWSHKITVAFEFQKCFQLFHSRVICVTKYLHNCSRSIKVKRKFGQRVNSGGCAATAATKTPSHNTRTRSGDFDSVGERTIVVWINNSTHAHTRGTLVMCGVVSGLQVFVGVQTAQNNNVSVQRKRVEQRMQQWKSGEYSSVEAGELNECEDDQRYKTEKKQKYKTYRYTAYE